mgnify:FL=1
MDIKRNQMIAIAIVAIVAISAIAIVVMNNGDKSNNGGLVFANGNKDCYEPTWLADELGYYSEFGAKVDMLTVSGGGKALEALRAGKADIAGFGSTPLANCLNTNDADQFVILARWMGGESYAEMATLVTNGETYDFSYPEGDTVKHTVTYYDGTTEEVIFKAMKGMTIGMDTSTGYKAAIMKYGSAAGLTVKFEGESGYGAADIKVKHVEFGNQVAALDQKDVDAIMGGSYDLAAYATVKKAVLSSPSQEKFPSLVSEATCVLVASKEAYAEKYDQIVGVLKALQKASCYIYGIDYEPGIYLDETTIKAKQAAMSDSKKAELFDDKPVKSLKGFYYRIDACKRIADFFGAPFTVDVQKLSYDKYIWGLEFDLVDMKIIEATYNASSTGTSSFRPLDGIDYMGYFDGRALYDAMKNKDGVSSWNSEKWYRDGSIYFYTLYHDGFKFETAADTYKLSWTVTDGEWILTLLKTNGQRYGAATISSITMGGTALDPALYDYDETTSCITLKCAVSGDVVVTVG